MSGKSLSVQRQNLLQIMQQLWLSGIMCWLPSQKRADEDSTDEQSTHVNKHTRDQMTVADTQLKNFTILQQANYHVAT
ncbi:hypothetical protein K0M31_016120 [Melipona bicolor]|uniref:Uncharacterized protein n=1 Tax=Melipona bicolor TaxID=60889 RepID=A0AA40G6R5_9HYME|nr:hypothetical protein K0M31_016120 [Melipona bicolor]